MVLEAKSHVKNCKNHFDAQRLRIFEYILKTVILNYSTIWLLTPTLSKNYTVTCLYYVSISVSVCLFLCNNQN